MKLKKIAAALAIGLTSLTITAQASEITKEQQTAISEKISKVNPQVEVLSISETPWKNVYEVVMKGNEIIYTNENGDFVMATDGREMMLLDINNRKNLTAEKKDQLNKIDYSTLDKKNSILLQKGKLGEISVFADPNCIHCKRFEATLKQTPDITVNLYLYPVLGADSQKKSEQVWCSKDKVTTWKNWMLDNKAIPEVDNCDTSAIKKNFEFAASAGITGTPTIIFSDGTRAAGALPPAALMMRVTEIAEKQKQEKTNKK